MEYITVHRIPPPQQLVYTLCTSQLDSPWHRPVVWHSLCSFHLHWTFSLSTLNPADYGMGLLSSCRGSLTAKLHYTFIQSPPMQILLYLSSSTPIYWLNLTKNVLYRVPPTTHHFYHWVSCSPILCDWLIIPIISLLSVLFIISIVGLLSFSGLYPVSRSPISSLLCLSL